MLARMRSKGRDEAKPRCIHCEFIRSDRPRLLIADEVGVGKTIEAGLILRELQARKEVKSVLVLCPKALVTDRKWERDLRRFDERFTQLDSKTLRYCINETHSTETTTDAAPARVTRGSIQMLSAGRLGPVSMRRNKPAAKLIPRASSRAS